MFGVLWGFLPGCCQVPVKPDGMRLGVLAIARLALLCASYCGLWPWHLVWSLQFVSLRTQFESSCNSLSRCDNLAVAGVASGVANSGTPRMAEEPFEKDPQKWTV